MNRTFDGDEVAVWLEKTKFWKVLPATCQTHKSVDGAGQGYANDKAIENRVVDDVEASPTEKFRGDK